MASPRHGFRAHDRHGLLLPTQSVPCRCSSNSASACSPRTPETGVAPARVDRVPHAWAGTSQPLRYVMQPPRATRDNSSRLNCGLCRSVAPCAHPPAVSPHAPSAGEGIRSPRGGPTRKSPASAARAPAASPVSVSTISVRQRRGGLASSWRRRSHRFCPAFLLPPLTSTFRAARPVKGQHASALAFTARPFTRYSPPPGIHHQTPLRAAALQPHAIKRVPIPRKHHHGLAHRAASVPSPASQFHGRQRAHLRSASAATHSEIVRSPNGWLQFVLHTPGCFESVRAAAQRIRDPPIEAICLVPILLDVTPIVPAHFEKPRGLGKNGDLRQPAARGSRHHAPVVLSRIPSSALSPAIKRHSSPLREAVQ